METEHNIQLEAAEERVLERSRVLRRELGLADLVLAQLMYMMIPEYFGTAAKAGPSHVVLWLLAIVAFFVPLALVVSHLNRLIPLEGGLYEWARVAFNVRVGFFVAWNLWLYVVMYMALVGLVTTNFVAYSLGPKAAWMTENKWLVLATSVGLMVAMIFLARYGFGVGKWVTNVGSVFTVIVLGALVVMPLANTWHGTLAGYHPLKLVVPPLTLFSLSVFSKMAFGALCGFEYVAIFAGECRRPEKNLARSILLTAPIIALLYIFGTSAILAFVPPDSVNVIAPIPQALGRGFNFWGFSGVIIPLAILMLLCNYLGTFNVNFNGSARLPMVAGWDRLLPEWFTRLHPKYKTPTNSIYFAGGVALAASIAVLIGVGEQEAFELLLVWAFTFYATAYLVLFAIPVLAQKEMGIRPALWLRIAAGSGFLVTLLAVVLSVFPIVDVRGRWEYFAKTVAVIAGGNALGALLWCLGPRTQERVANHIPAD